MAHWNTWIAPPVRRRLALMTAASFALPWLVGELAKSGYRVGTHDDAQRIQLMIDFIVIGGIVFALTMVLTCAIGSFIVGVMRGPRLYGDPFPPASLEALRDD